MKRIYLVFVAVLMGVTANAQIEGLDEIELLGTWYVMDRAGIFNNAQFPVYNNERKRPKAFTFTDNDNSSIEWEFAGGPSVQQYPGYWITHTSARYVLHLITRLGYDGYTSLSLLNFVVTQFDGSTMTLQTYSGDGTLYLTKDTSAGVNAARIDAPKGTAYTIAGIKLPTPEKVKGVVIQNGRKVIK